MLHSLILHSPQPCHGPATFISLLWELQGVPRGASIHRSSGLDPCQSDQFCEDPIQRNPQVVLVSCCQAQHNGIDS